MSPATYVLDKLLPWSALISSIAFVGALALLR